MRKLSLFVLLSGLAGFLSGCEDVEQEKTVETFRLAVSMPDISDTQVKTYIERMGDVYRTYWNNGDDISINGNISSSLAAGGEHCAEFVFDGYSPAEGEIMNILHPGSSASGFVIPSEQTYSDGGYPSAAAPMWSTAVHPSDVTMNHLCSILSLNFHGEGTISKVVLTAAGGENISGEFMMGFSEGAYNGSFTGGESPQITITFSPGIALSEQPASLNIPVLAGRYTKGFTAKIYNSEGLYQSIKMYSKGKTLDPLKVYERPDDLFKPVENGGALGDFDENIMFDNRSLTVGTYNILASSARGEAGDNTWDAAKETIVSIISDMNCDVMTLNELFQTEVDYLTSELEGYEWVLHHNYESEYNYEYNFAPGIIYNPVRLEKLSDGIFWLSDPNATSLKTTQGCYSYWDTNYDTAGLLPDEHKAGEHRCCVWAKFRDRSTGYSFYYFASHPEIRGADSGSSKTNTLDCLNAGNIRSLVAQVPLVDTEGVPFIVAGDMNTYSNHISYSVFTDAGWTDSYTAASSAKCIDTESQTKPGTDVGIDPNSYVTTEARRIDLVLYQGFGISSYETIRTQYNKIYPSDHLPVKVKLTLLNP